MENRILVLMREATRFKNPILLPMDILWHKIKINTSPIDYLRFEFFKGNKSWAAKSRYVGKRGSNYFPWRSNAVQFVSLFDNKYIFSTMLSGFSLPHPKLLATVGKDYEIKEFEQFAIFMKNTKSNMVLKPLDGSGGQGIFVLRFKDDHYETIHGCSTVEDIWSKIKKGNIPYLIESLIEQDSNISTIYPHSLNTLRIITIRTNDAKWHVIHGSMRLGQQKAQVDNVGLGGIMVALNSEGKVVFAYDWRRKQVIEEHPDTKTRLIDFVIPRFQEATALALKASKKFSFMGTVGWDIGLSNDGPIIIEGNVFYDCYPLQMFELPPLIPDQVASKLNNIRFWHRWDKTKIHPKVNRYKITG